MATPLSDFYEVLRVVLADRDPDIHIYDDDQLSAGMRAVIRLGKIKSDLTTYKLTPDKESVTGAEASVPDLVPEDDSVAYARLIYHTAKLFVVSLTSSSFRTRAFAESFGNSKELITDILQEVYQIENGAQAD